jgi:hypothetical protein
LIFRCTKKLLDKLDIQARDSRIEAQPGGPLDEWYCNLVRLGRKQYVIFTVSQTLFCVVGPHAIQADLDNFSRFFRGSLAIALSSHGISESKINHLTAPGPDVFAVTASRSIVGSMAEYVRLLDGYLQDPSLDIRTLHLNLNIAPMNGIGMQSAGHLMAQAVASIK